MKVKLADGRIKDVALTEVTPENYILPDNPREKRMYHVLIEVKKFDANTGARLSRPRLQKFGRKYFESAGQRELQKQGYTLTILHDPKTYIAEEQTRLAEAAQAKKAEAEAQKQADIDAAVEAALAKQAEAHKAEIEAAVAKALAKKGKKGKETE